MYFHNFIKVDIIKDTIDKTVFIISINMRYEDGNKDTVNH